METIKTLTLYFDDLNEKGFSTIEREVLRLRYLTEGDPLSLEEVSNRLGLTRERIRQIEAKAISFIRNGKGLFSKKKEDLSLCAPNDAPEGGELARQIKSIVLSSPKEEADLDPLTIKVLSLRYPTNGKRPSLEEVSKELCITREKVRQIEAKALSSYVKEDSILLGFEGTRPYFANLDELGNTFLCGTTAAGKTTLFHHLLRELKKKGKAPKKILILDTKNVEYGFFSDIAEIFRGDSNLLPFLSRLKEIEESEEKALVLIDEGYLLMYSESGKAAIGELLRNHKDIQIMMSSQVKATFSSILDLGDSLIQFRPRDNNSLLKKKDAPLDLRTGEFLLKTSK